MSICHFVCIFWMKEQSYSVYTVWHSVCIVWIKEQSDQDLHCLPFRLHLLDEEAAWSGSTLFATPFASFGWRSSLIRVYTVCHSICIVWMKEQSDQGLHCHSICIIWMKEQSDQGLHCLPFHEGAVWSESTLFAHFVCIREHSVCIVWIKEQSDQGLHCLPFRLDEGAVWSGSTLFAFLFASFGQRSNLIRVYTVCHSVCIVWWRSSLIWVYPVCHSIRIVLMKEQCDQGLHCLPFRLHRLDEGVVWSGSPLSFYLHRLDEGTVWSGSTLFAIPFASFGWLSSLIRVYTVYHSICTIRMKEQSDQGLHYLPFRLHRLDEGVVWSGFRLSFRLHGLDEGAVWSGSTIFAIPFASFGWMSSLIRVYTVCHSVCTVWMNGAVWSESTLFAIPFASGSAVAQW